MCQKLNPSRVQSGGQKAQADRLCLCLLRRTFRWNKIYRGYSIP